MSPYFKPLPAKLVLGFILITTAIIIHSCRKDKYSQSPPTTKAIKAGINVDIAQLQQIYASAIKDNSLLKLNSGNGNVNLIRSLSVNWNTYTLQKRKDSSIIAEFDMNSDTGVFAFKQYRPGDTIRYINKTTVVFIKFSNGTRLNFFTKIIEDLTAPGSKSVVKKMHYGEVPLGFNGTVLYYTFGLTFINGYHFTNGVVDKTVTLSATNPGNTQTINSLRTDVTQTCEFYPIYEYECTVVTYPGGSYDQGCTSTVVGYDVECDGSGDGSVTGDTGGTSGGGSPAPQPCTPTNTVAETSVSNGHLIINVTEGGGSGSGTGSGTGTTPPPCPPDTPVPDPCSYLTQVITLAQNIVNSTMDHQIYNTLGTGHEYGADQNLNAWPNGSYMPATLTSDYNESSLTANFTWNPTNGYTINIAHSHPNGGAPSPADVFKLYVNSNNSDLNNAGASAISFYEANASITVITQDATYVVMGADYTQLASLYTQYKSSLQPDGTYGFNTTYENIAGENNGSTEIALLKMFGNSINLYKSDANSNNFYPITLNANGEIVAIQCP